jgi:hypothetical protein
LTQADAFLEQMLEINGRTVQAIVTLIEVQLRLAEAYAEAGDTAASQAFQAKARATAQHLAQLEPALGEASSKRVAQAEQSLGAPSAAARTPSQVPPRPPTR